MYTLPDASTATPLGSPMLVERALGPRLRTADVAHVPVPAKTLMVPLGATWRTWQFLKSAM